jgi:RNA binding exosome subunit
MSNFFDSEIIQSELDDIKELQQIIYDNILSFSSMTKEEKINHIDTLSILLEKQKVMYTRLSLSDDPDAIETKNNFKKSLEIMGFPKDTDMNILFNNMTRTIETLKKSI